MNQILSKLAGASLLASIVSPLTMLASSAKDLTAAEIANMAESSAVRMGCGVSIGLVDSVNVAGTIYNPGQIMVGVFATSAMVVLAIRFLPKPAQAECWNIIHRTAHIYFWVGLIVTAIAFAAAGSLAGTIALTLWAMSSMFFLCTAVRATYRVNKELVLCILSKSREAHARFNNLYVRVDGNAVTLKQGLHSQTRVVEESAVAVDTQNEEAEACLTR